MAKARQIIMEALLRALPCRDANIESREAVTDHIIADLHAAGFKILAREPSQMMLAKAAWAKSWSGVWRSLWDEAP